MGTSKDFIHICVRGKKKNHSLYFFFFNPVILFFLENIMRTARLSK